MLQGVGYPEPNLSHFRSIEIWDTASRSNEYLQDGWLTRAFAAAPTPATYAADGVIIGSNDMGPLAGGGTRAIALADHRALRRARKPRAPETIRAAAKRSAHPEDRRRHRAGGAAASRRVTHVRDGLSGRRRSAAPSSTACQVVANRASVADGARDAERLRHARRAGGDAGAAAAGFRARHRRAARRTAAKSTAGTTTLVLTYAEFGRRPQENASGGTDHGTANVHLALGGRVAGGMYGESRRWRGSPPTATSRYALDFRASTRRCCAMVERRFARRRSARASPRCRSCGPAASRALRAPRREELAPVRRVDRRHALARERDFRAYSPAASSPRISRKRW